LNISYNKYKINLRKMKFANIALVATAAAYAAEEDE
tara:strand:- start:733 stop:840 length:108 start_codon:yes stop_codon:yes gene_type:complete